MHLQVLSRVLQKSHKYKNGAWSPLVKLEMKTGNTWDAAPKQKTVEAEIAAPFFFKKLVAWLIFLSIG